MTYYNTMDKYHPQNGIQKRSNTLVRDNLKIVSLFKFRFFINFASRIITKELGKEKLTKFKQSNATWRLPVLKIFIANLTTEKSIECNVDLL